MEYNLLYPMDIMNEKDFREYVFKKAQSVLTSQTPKAENLKEGIFFPEPPDSIKAVLAKPRICSIHQAYEPLCSICNAGMTSSSVNEEITPSSVKDLVDQIKKINSSLSFSNSLIDQTLNEVEDSASSTKRYLKVANYENKNIEIGENLNETMSIYNKKKDVTRNKESDEDSWKRLINYNKFKE